MCLGDWRLGRLVRHQITRLNTLNSAPQPIQANQQRVQIDLRITGPTAIATATVLVLCDTVAVAILNINKPWISFSLTESGDLPTRGFTFSTASDNNIVTAIEYFMPEDYLATGLSQFKSEYSQWLNLHFPKSPTRTF